jgi:hypothetical protein
LSASIVPDFAGFISLQSLFPAVFFPQPASVLLASHTLYCYPRMTSQKSARLSFEKFLRQIGMIFWFG